jgi:hypothetical protein
MRGDVPLLPNTPSWRGAQLRKTQGQVYLYLYLPSGLKPPLRSNADVPLNPANFENFRSSTILKYVTGLQS